MREVRPTGLAVVLRVNEFRALWIAEVLSVAGDQLARVALALLVFARTGSASLTAVTYALTFVPALIGGWLLSGLADRWPRRTVLVVTDLVRAGLAAVMAVPGLPLWALWTVVVALTLAGAPFKAAQQALLPEVLPEEGQYKRGLAVRVISNQCAQLVGFGAGGALVVAVSPAGAMLLNSATFVAARPGRSDRCGRLSSDVVDVERAGVSWSADWAAGVGKPAWQRRVPHRGIPAVLTYSRRGQVLFVSSVALCGVLGVR